MRGTELGSRIADPLQALAVPIESLTPDPANARKHGTKNLDAIKASLAKFGQRKPIVVQRAGMVVRAGNGTLQAAKALGWTEIAAVVLDDDNATASQFAIADNRSAELAEWDDETLALLLDGMDPGDREWCGKLEPVGNGVELLWSKQPHKRRVYQHLWSGITAKERTERRVHPTQKPVALTAQVIEDHAPNADLVLDPFLGSGTTLIAGEQTGRKVRGIEIEPRYCDVIVQRWETLTGKKAVRPNG